MVVDMFENEKQFLAIRYQIFEQQFPTQKPKQTNIITVTTDINNEGVNDTVRQSPSDKEEKSRRNLIIHFQYEERMKSCQKDIHHIWDKTFRETPIKNTRLVIGTCNSRNGTKEMVTKHPARKSLRLKTITE